MLRPRKPIAGLMAALFVFGLVGPVQATHNLSGRIWEYYPYGSYDYAPRYAFAASVPTTCRTRFRNAAAKWNNQNRELRFVEGTGTVWIHVKYFDLEWPNGAAYAFTAFDLFTSISWSDINFNTSADVPGGPHYPYCGYQTPAGNEYDLESLAIHELGHNHEQLHTTTTANVMYCCFYGGQIKRTPTAHDYASLAALYPAVSP